MMNRILIALISFSVLGLDIGISHAAEKYALICRATQSIDYSTGKVTELTPEDQTFVVEDRTTGAVIVSAPGRFCDTAKVNQTTDASFFIRCEGKIGDKDYTQTYRIDRYSGRFEDTFVASSSRGPVTHIGECRKAKKRF